MSAGKKQALGRGLSALLQNPETDITTREIGEAKVDSIAGIPIDFIEANPFNPRNRFEQEALDNLAQSIKELGIIQPVTVRKVGINKYQLISGERRFRASQIAGLKSIPAYVRIADDKAMLELALVENLQREDLNPVEVALSFERLIDECNFTQEELSERVGKNRTTISNFLRLLKLPPEIQVALVNKRLSMGHAKPLVAIEDTAFQIAVFKRIITQDLSVRAVEDIVKNKSNGETATNSSSKTLVSKTQSTAKEQLIAKALETKVAIKQNEKGAGSIVIKFKNNDELERIISALQ